MKSEDLMSEAAAAKFPETALETTKPELEKSAMLKIDLLLMPMLTMFLFSSFLDRGNIGNVKVIGLMEDLRMTERDFSLLLTFHFIPYAVRYSDFLQ